MSSNALNKRVCVVAWGGTRELGREMAFKFGAEGWTVVIFDTNMKQAEQVANEIGKRGGSAAAVKCDINEDRQLPEIMMKVIELFGKVDLMISPVD